METSIVVRGLGKKFRQYHSDRPIRLSEIFVKGPKKIKPKKIVWGLRNVSFEIKTGKIMGVIGRNGSGKSTLLRLIGGVYLPDEGFVRVKGRIGALLAWNRIPIRFNWKRKYIYQRRHCRPITQND